jgi:hypothetical protein
MLRTMVASIVIPSVSAVARIFTSVVDTRDRATKARNRMKAAEVISRPVRAREDELSGVTAAFVRDGLVGGLKVMGPRRRPGSCHPRGNWGSPGCGSRST